MNMIYLNQSSNNAGTDIRFSQYLVSHCSICCHIPLSTQRSVPWYLPLVCSLVYLPNCVFFLYEILSKVQVSKIIKCCLIMQDGSLDLNAAESGVQHKPTQAGGPRSSVNPGQGKQTSN